MKFNRHSIFLKLNFLFSIALLSITAIFLIFFFISEKRHMGIVMGDSKHVMRLIHMANRTDITELPSMLHDEGFEIMTDKEKILKSAKTIKYPRKFLRHMQKRFKEKNLEIVKFNSNYYYHVNLPRHKLLIKNKPYQSNFLWILFAYLSIMSILLFTYLALGRSLKPIKKLENEIKKFGEGNLSIDTKSDKKDEIASVANQFHNAVQKIEALQSTRTLFMRNMMHELKTPITKGKLSLSLMEENSEKEMLGRVFDRLEALINEMADIERISTQNIVLDIAPYSVESIINQAKELLYLEDEKIISTLNAQKITCDFHLFTIAVKNLIDNAIKYSNDGKVEIKVDEKSITFINSGDPLKDSFAHYVEPFYKGTLNPINQKGFGLGLYIVSEIVKIHGFSLLYVYSKHRNNFTISF